MPVNTIHINNRRYLGNKFKLTDFIHGVVNNHCDNIRVVADLFAGTGSVAYSFSSECQIITNDILYCNYISNYAWLSCDAYDKEKLIGFVSEYNSLHTKQRNYMSINFSDTYFSHEDCSKIGFIREDIERKYKSNIINFHEKAILITSLLYAMDKIAKTCGHYDAYRKGAAFDEHLELCIPDIQENLNINNVFYNQDINILAPTIQADLVYLDPPYNSRQYSDSYHLLENVARWKKPKVFGTAKKMDRENLKSKYCSREASIVFDNLIQSLNSRYILLSYNNMAEKGNDRSNARMKDEDIIRSLSRKGRVEVFSNNYKAFTTGKSDHSDNEERLFLCTCL